MSDRQALSMPSFDDDMDDFAPRAAAPKPVQQPAPKAKAAGQGASAPKPAAPTPRAADTRRAIDAVSQFPSREATRDGQLNLKGPQHVLDRFKAMCKADRRAYYDMLEILMDQFEGKGQGAR
ncbi:hypothetical protein [Tropicibacter naphthalenivorans]|uniref:Uncharacterized protein n=1 Tax=Tropicibacter naphthalenivorans TaxID=441103 RepID=A0A0P1GK33_9RHOB|nr:hypothetical protein [Tropicibacter naphthalenivorans]CUH82354.1 hypothetical protein TRN7648_03927 [Tropicibacter naphthalenivorans]SMD05740.1 hypothetical protein SAMN04488093_11341 [Tropicibacter naphthalenivorans]